MAQASNAPEREQNVDSKAPDTKVLPSGNTTTPINSAKVEAVAAEVAVKAGDAAVSATAAPEVEARAAFEAEAPEFDPVPAPAPAPVAPPASQAIPVAPKPVSAPALALAPPSADEYHRMLARRAASAPADDKPHPSTVPVALRPTPQGPHYPAKG